MKTILRNNASLLLLTLATRAQAVDFDVAAQSGNGAGDAQTHCTSWAAMNTGFPP